MFHAAFFVSFAILYHKDRYFCTISQIYLFCPKKDRNEHHTQIEAIHNVQPFNERKMPIALRYIVIVDDKVQQIWK